MSLWHMHLHMYVSVTCTVKFVKMLLPAIAKCNTFQCFYYLQMAPFNMRWTILTCKIAHAKSR